MVTLSYPSKVAPGPSVIGIVDDVTVAMIGGIALQVSFLIDDRITVPKDSSSRDRRSYRAVIFSVCLALMTRSFQTDGSFVAHSSYHILAVMPTPYVGSVA